MAQKIFPRSRRSQRLLSSDVSFYGEKNYADLWAQSYQLMTSLLTWSQQNQMYKNPRQKNRQKRSHSTVQLPSYLKGRFWCSKSMGMYHLFPILVKPSGLNQKYNPIKAVHKRSQRTRYSGQKSFLNNLERWQSG